MQRAPLKDGYCRPASNLAPAAYRAALNCKVKRSPSVLLILCGPSLNINGAPSTSLSSARYRQMPVFASSISNAGICSSLLKGSAHDCQTNKLCKMLKSYAKVLKIVPTLPCLICIGVIPVLFLMNREKEAGDLNPRLNDICLQERKGLPAVAPVSPRRLNPFFRIELCLN